VAAIVELDDLPVPPIVSIGFGNIPEVKSPPGLNVEAGHLLQAGDRFSDALGGGIRRG
jgi:hypothetical protein